MSSLPSSVPRGFSRRTLLAASAAGLALVAAGWLQSVGRGTWAIPGPRVVPLLVVVSAGLAR